MRCSEDDSYTTIFIGIVVNFHLMGGFRRQSSNDTESTDNVDIQTYIHANGETNRQNLKSTTLDFK